MYFIFLIFITIFLYQCTNSKKNPTTPVSSQKNSNSLSQNPASSSHTKSFNVNTGEFFPDQYTIGLWHFNQLKDDILIDVSSYENYAFAPNSRLIKGRFGKALFFDGQSTYVEIENTESLSSKKAITIELWVLINDEQRAQFPVIVSKDMIQEGSGNPSYEIFLNNTLYKNIIWRVNTTEKEYNLDTGIRWPKLANGRWHYLVATYNSKEMTFYLNGSLVKTIKTKGSMLNNTNPLRLSRKYEKDKNFFHGVIDELRLSNIARSQMEISKYWNTF